MWIDSLLSALLNVGILFGLPFLGYGLYHRLRYQRGWWKSARRAGLQMGEARYLIHGAGISFLLILFIVVWPPPLEPLIGKGSAMAEFQGLEFLPALLLGLIYGVVKTGFAEEFLFRGLIAGSLGRWLSLWAANLVQAGIFLLPHLLVLALMEDPRWELLSIIIVIALAAGWLRIRSGSIVAPWLVHSSVNVATSVSVSLRT